MSNCLSLQPKLAHDLDGASLRAMEINEFCRQKQHASKWKLSWVGSLCPPFKRQPYALLQSDTISNLGLIVNFQ